MQDEINCFESAPQVEQTLTNLEITLTPDAENASTQNVPTPSHVVIFTFYSLVIVKLYYA